MPGNHGMRSVATCRPISGSRSTSTRTSRTPFTWFRLRAIRITSCLRASCACIGAGANAGVIRIALPANLRTLAGVGREVQLQVDGPVSQRSLLDALEAEYPMLRGTIRDQTTKRRRAMLRFFACEEDLSDESPDAPLPREVATGREPYLIIGAIAGG